MSITVEEQRIRSLFDRAETVEDVAKTLPGDGERWAKLLAVSDAALAEEGTVRPSSRPGYWGFARRPCGRGRRRACCPSPSGRRGGCWMCEAS